MLDDPQDQQLQVRICTEAGRNGEEGALLVDTGTLAMAEQTIAAVKQVMAGVGSCR